MEIRAGLEPVIATVKGLCPNHLDERTMSREEAPAFLSDGIVSDEDIIYTNVQQSCKSEQIIDRWQRSPILPLVYGLWGVEAKRHLEIMNRETGSLTQVHDIGTCQCQINRWKVHRVNTSYLNYLPVGMLKAACLYFKTSGFNNSDRSILDQPVVSGH